jgi:tRNA pseudouridine55 synthase
MTKEDFLEGQTILIDKPLRWTSFDAVNKIRWKLKKKFNLKNIKVGHAGTLDPLATGLLVICIGKHTKKIETLMAGKKIYTGTILLGKTTPSYDLETEFDKEFPVDHIDDALMEKVSQTFIGEIDQVPPVFSAKQIDGKRAYDYAREGKEVVMKTNKVLIDSFSINSERFPEVDFEITCSKGTYIRSIANDFGKMLGSGGTLIALRRTASGEQRIEDSVSVDDYLKTIEEL